MHITVEAREVKRALGKTRHRWFIKVKWFFKEQNVIVWIRFF
jgi:hypothetical protein